MSKPGMKYRKYSPETRKAVIEDRIKNPKMSYQALAKKYQVACVETIRYWINSGIKVNKLEERGKTTQN